MFLLLKHKSPVGLTGTLPSPSHKAVLQQGSVTPITAGTVLLFQMRL